MSARQRAGATAREESKQGRAKDRQTDGQTDRQTDRQSQRQTERQGAKIEEMNEVWLYEMKVWKDV